VDVFIFVENNISCDRKCLIWRLKSTDLSCFLLFCVGVNTWYITLKENIWT